MAKLTSTKLVIAAIGGVSLAACGGGGERPGGAPAPLQPPPPSPQPPPLAAPAIPAGPTGLQSDQPFSTQAAWSDGSGMASSGDDQVQISYSAADDLYTLTLPGTEPGQLHPLGGNGSYNEQGWITLKSTHNEVRYGGQPALNLYVALDWPASSPYSYTSFGTWGRGCPMGPCETGVFAYGIPTAAGDVPISGSATYNGEIRGVTDYAYDVWGSVVLNFDFAAGTLAGEMNPIIASDWDGVSLGTYTFRDTVYSSGSTNFSGSFLAPAGLSGPSWFSGTFTGPGGAELQASWQAPYMNPQSNQPGSITGVWIASRGN